MMMMILMMLMFSMTVMMMIENDDLLTKERMKRQMEALQERVSGAPSDIGDIRFTITAFLILDVRKSDISDIKFSF